jgi:hypothetical protein
MGQGFSKAREGQHLFLSLEEGPSLREPEQFAAREARLTQPGLCDLELGSQRREKPGPTSRKRNKEVAALFPLCLRKIVSIHWVPLTRQVLEAGD